jgi:NADPH-dependent glutamate synthase beta subunit-like oxidoreductase
MAISKSPTELWVVVIGGGLVCLGVIFFAMSGNSSGHTEAIKLHIGQPQIALEEEKNSSENVATNLKASTNESRSVKNEPQVSPTTQSDRSLKDAKATEAISVSPKVSTSQEIQRKPNPALSDNASANIQDTDKAQEKKNLPDKAQEKKNPPDKAQEKKNPPDKAQEQKNPQDVKPKEGEIGKSDTSKPRAPDLTANTILNGDGRNSISAHLGDVILLELFKTT